MISRILVARGIESFEAAKAYFRPDISQLHDPWLMKDMDLAVKRILLAIDQKEKILVFGDYDVDGTSSVAHDVSTASQNSRSRICRFLYSAQTA